MNNKSTRFRLEDILKAIDNAQFILDSADFAEYQRDIAKRMGVERCIEIISEASRHVPHELTQRHPEIPWPEIRGIGNILRHHYQHVSDLIIWRTARKSLPELRIVIADFLAENPD